MVVSAPGGKKVSSSERGVKSFHTDLKKSHMSSARIPRLPEQCIFSKAL